MELGQSLFRLLSEGLGLDQNHLLDIGCHEGLILIGHYYPPCPEPERTFGIRKHSDNNFMTILVQDHVGGLQVMHQNQWVDVEPIPGALIVNIGNILQASFFSFVDYWRQLIGFPKIVVDLGIENKLERLF